MQANIGNIRISNRSFESVSDTVQVFGNDSNKSKNLIHEEIKRRLNSGNICCHTAQSVLVSLPAVKNHKN
jgi:hypothetical protein